MNKKILNIEPAVFYLILILTFIFQSYFKLYLVNDFNWLAFIHHDLIYQVERLLLNMKFHGIEMLNSSNSDYGSELWLLIPIYKLYELFLSNPKPIHAYYFLTVIHLCCGILSLFLIRYLLKKNRTNLIGSSLLASIVVSSSLFIQYLSFIKPDPNIVLLCVVSSFLFLLFFHETAKRKWLILALIVSALATAIKWWGIFMLFPITYTVSLKEENTGREYVNIKHIFLTIIISCLILFLIQIMAVHNITHVLTNNEGEKVYDEFLNKYQFLLKIFAQKSGYFINFFIAAAGGLIWYTIMRGMSNLKEKFSERERGIRYASINYVFLFTKLFSVFMTLFLIFNSPFLLSNQILYSVYDFSQNLTFSSHGPAENKSISPFLNIKRWIDFLVAYRILSGFVISGIFFSIYAYLKKLKRTGSCIFLNQLLLYLVPVIVFLFLFVKKRSAGVTAMLFPLGILFILISILDFLNYLPNRKRTIATFLVVLFALFHVLSQNFMVTYTPAYSLYNNRYQYDLEGNIKNLNGQLLSSINKVSKGNNDTLLFLCQRDLPIDEKLSKIINYRQLDFKECRDSLASTLNSGNFIVFTDMQKSERFKSQIDSLIESGKINFITELNAKKYTLEGEIMDYKAYLYYVN